jgi:glycosyltransferase involved in cell wall biosynthesis
MIYTHVWAPVVGGLQTVTRDLANGLANWGQSHPGQAIDVTLVTQTPAGTMNDSGVPFRVVRQPSNRQLISLIRSADVVHIANPALMPLALGWLLGKPIVLEHDGYQSACPNGLFLFQPDTSVCPGHYLAGRYGKCLRCNAAAMGWSRSLRTLLLTFPRRWLARKVAVNIAPTRHIGRRVALPRTRVIPHGVPEYSTSAISASPSNAADVPCFAYVGRLVAEKGLPVLLDACSILCKKGASFRLKIVGDGTERIPLERLAAELGLGSQVEFLGSFSVENIPNLLSEAAAVIMPSIWEDVAPLVAYEQLMHGHLVIASDLGGLGEIVDDVGLKFPAGDAEALAECMGRVLEEPDLVKDLRSRALQRAREAFTLEHMVANHIGVFNELAGTSAG